MEIRWDSGRQQGFLDSYTSSKANFAVQDIKGGVRSRRGKMFWTCQMRMYKGGVRGTQERNKDLYGKALGEINREISRVMY